ncbi:MAG: hypothetical protein KY453_04225 [Gemmatimonadetes bacterium]|nr:hypothetical protein [Gemmatimonadota bacterium]
MIRGLLRTARYARSWGGRARVTTHETAIERGGARLPATLILPAVGRGPHPGWIVLGGVTRMGRFHPQLVRFAEALASSGAAVLVPEVPEWRDLRIVPSVAAPTLRAGIRALRGRREVRPGKVGVVGLSFGAAQVALASTQEDLAADIAGIALFGGYFDLERTLRCMITGVHEWKGERHRLIPDPYGRWVVAANHLTLVPGYEDAGDVADALRRLALAATEKRIPAWLPEHDALKNELRPCIAECRRHVFDFFAPLTDAPQPCCEEGDVWAARLAEACRNADPLLEPAGRIDRVRAPTRLIHGRNDRLVPYTESLRFAEAIPPGVDVRVTVTGLFAHSANLAPPSLADRAREGVRLFEAIRGLINVV